MRVLERDQLNRNEISTFFIFIPFYRWNHEWYHIDDSSSAKPSEPPSVGLESGPQDVLNKTPTTVKTTTSTTKTTTKSTTKATTKATTDQAISTTTSTTTKTAKQTTTRASTEADQDYLNPDSVNEPTKPSTKKPSRLDNDEEDFMVSKGINRVIMSPEYHIHHTFAGTVVLGKNVLFLV